MEQCERLVAYIESLGYAYNVAKQDERGIQLDVSKGNFTLKVVYDGADDIYGFFVIGVGIKPFDTFEEFRDYFETYMSIHTDFLPKANMMSEFFEKHRGIIATYSHFIGNMKDGYTALFNVNGEPAQTISVDYRGNLYRLRYNINNEVVATYGFVLDETDRITPVMTPDYYFDLMTERMKKISDEYDFNRISDNSFFLREKATDLKLVYSIIRPKDYNKPYCSVTKVNNIDVSIDWHEEAILDVASLYAHVRVNINPESIGEMPTAVETVTEEVTEEVAETVTEDALEEVASELIDTVVDETVEDTEDDSTEDSDEEVYEESVNMDIPDSFNEVFGNEEHEQTVPDTVAVSVMSDGGLENMGKIELSLVQKDGVIVSVRFKTEDGLFDMPVETAKKLGVPVKRIVSCSDIEVINGMLMTREEFNCKQFATELDDSDDLCRVLIDHLFD